MKSINRSKRGSSVVPQKRPAKKPKVSFAQNPAKHQKESHDNNLNQNTENHDEQNVSPQVIRTTFDSIKVYLENLKAFYINESEKLGTRVKTLEREVTLLSHS